MIPKFRVAFKNNILGEVGSIDFVDETVTIPVYDKVDGEYLGDNVWGLNQVTLMQSTGLFDNSTPKKEIFEGDIVYAYSEGARLIGAIEYFDNAYCIKTKNGVYNSLWTNAEYYEIVGSVFENPELVEELK